MQVPNRLSDLRKEDFRELVRATRPVCGRGIVITDTADGRSFAIDENEFKRMLWTFERNGGFRAEFADLDNVPLDLT